MTARPLQPHVTQNDVRFQRRRQLLRLAGVQSCGGYCVCDGAICNGGNVTIDGGTLTATATSITGNTASLGGAAGGIENHGTVHLHRDTIQSNTPVNCSNVPGCTG